MPKVKSKQKQKQKQRQSVVVNVNTKPAPRRRQVIRRKAPAPSSFAGTSYIQNAPQSSIADLLQIFKLPQFQQQEAVRDILVPIPAPALPRATTIDQVLSPAIHAITAPYREEDPIIVSPVKREEEPLIVREEPLLEDFTTRPVESPVEEEIAYNENPLAPKKYKSPKVKARPIQSADISTQRTMSEYFNIDQTNAPPHTEDEVKSFGVYLSKRDELPQAKALPAIAKALPAIAEATPAPKPAKKSKFYMTAEARAVVALEQSKQSKGRPASEELLQARRDIVKHNEKLENIDNPIVLEYPNGTKKSLTTLKRELRLGTPF